MKPRFTHAPLLRYIGTDMTGAMSGATSKESPILMQGLAC